MFSVDYPFSPNAEGCNFLNPMSISPEDMEKIARRNADRCRSSEVS